MSKHETMLAPHVASLQGILSDKARTIFISTLIAAGAAVRLALLFQVGSAPEGALTGGSDAPAYIILAHSLATGHGLAYMGQPTALRAPLYPLILSWLDSGFGSHAFLVMRILQFVAAVLTGIVCAKIAGELWEDDSKPVAFALAFSIPTLLFFTMQILTETFAAFLVCLFLYFSVRTIKDENRRSPLIGMGVCTGLLLLLRFNAVFIPFVMICIVLRVPITWKSIKRAAVPVVIAGIFVCPWLIRNAIVFHGGVLYSSQTGITALQGALSPSGRTQPQDAEAWSSAGWWLSDIETDTARRLQFPSEVQLNKMAIRAAWTAWRSLGVRAVPLLVEKFFYFWLSTDQLFQTADFSLRQRLLRASGVLFYWFALVLAVGGFMRLRRSERRISNALLLYCIAATLLHLPVTMNTRLRSPLIDPLICVLAAGELSVLFGKRRAATEGVVVPLLR